MKTALALFLFFAFSFESLAAPVSQDRAATAARRWLELTPSPMQRKAGTFEKISGYANAAGEPLFYVVDLQPAGFVVVAADDEIEPIIAFSHEDEFVGISGLPLFDLLQRDLEDRVQRLRTTARASLQTQPSSSQERTKWERLKPQTVQSAVGGREAASPVAPLPQTITPDDVRVAQLLSSQWNQAYIPDPNTPPYGIAVYNFYTPNNYRCGCVATALAQIMRYHKWPKTSVATTDSFACVVTAGSTYTIRATYYPGSDTNYNATTVDSMWTINNVP